MTSSQVMSLTKLFLPKWVFLMCNTPARGSTNTDKLREGLQPS